MYKTTDTGYFRPYLNCMLPFKIEKIEIKFKLSLKELNLEYNNICTNDW